MLVPVANDTKHAIKLSEKAVELGVDGLLVVTPYYNKTSQEGLVHHYTKIAEKVPKTPMILYDVPGRTGMSIQPETYKKLLKNLNIVAVKEAMNRLGMEVGGYHSPLTEMSNEGKRKLHKTMYNYPELLNTSSHFKK